MKIAYVRWVDSSSPQGVWSRRQDAHYSHEKMMCDSVGRILKEDDEVLTLYMSEFYPPEEGSVQGSISIPKAAIVERWILEVKDYCY